MKVPSIKSNIWRDVISGKKAMQFHFLAAQILVARSRIQIRSLPQILPKVSEELYTLLTKNIQLPTVQKDIAKLVELEKKQI